MGKYEKAEAYVQRLADKADEWQERWDSLPEEKRSVDHPYRRMLVRASEKWSAAAKVLNLVKKEEGENDGTGWQS